MWLGAIIRDTDLRVPEPAAPIYQGRVGEAPIYCTLLHWLDGEPVPPAVLTLEQAWQIGALAARLHQHSAGFAPPDGFALSRLDWTGMFGEKSPYRSTEGELLFSRQQRDVMEEVANAVRQVMDTMEKDADGFGVIHADLIWKNILFDGDRVGAIDFDDCAYGYYLYDLAPALLGYMDEPNYRQIRRSIWEGYTSVRPLPELYSTFLETLIAGRYTLSCWWIAANAHNPAIGGRAPNIIAYRVGELQRFLETGKLRRGEIIV
jgi:Ser/Thr protein kinase RdoA (MazF antagonist)